MKSKVSEEERNLGKKTNKEINELKNKKVDKNIKKSPSSMSNAIQMIKVFFNFISD